MVSARVNRRGLWVRWDTHEAEAYEADFFAGNLRHTGCCCASECILPEVQLCQLRPLFTSERKHNWKGKNGNLNHGSG